MRFLQADAIFEGTKFLENESVLAITDKGEIDAILLQADVEPSRIEKLNGCLMPGFVNAHCHLELSHLKGAVPMHTQLPGFAMSLMKQRGNFSHEKVQEAIAQADEEMWQNGIVAVGDICNGTDSLSQKSKSSIYYHSFIELIALNPTVSNYVFDKGLALLKQFEDAGLAASFAAHAPYSVSPELAVMIADYNTKQKLPSSIHNQESMHEQNFLWGKNSDFEALYKFLNLDISFFIPPHRNGLEIMHKALVAQPRIFVHNTFTSAADCALAANNATFWCMCPNANLYIENTLPDYSVFPKNQLCIGTDSLASNHTLNLCDEANVILQVSKLETSTLLRALTYDGARALGIEKQFGRIEKAKKPGLNLVNINDGKLQFNRKIV